MEWPLVLNEIHDELGLLAHEIYIGGDWYFRYITERCPEGREGIQIGAFPPTWLENYTRVNVVDVDPNSPS